MLRLASKIIAWIQKIIVIRLVKLEEWLSSDAIAIISSIFCSIGMISRRSWTHKIVIDP